MNAAITVAITEKTGKTDVLIIRHDRNEYLAATKTTITRTRAHNNITDASFSRIARLLANRGKKSHGFGEMTHYKVK